MWRVGWGGSWRFSLPAGKGKLGSGCGFVAVRGPCCRHSPWAQKQGRNFYAFVFGGIQLLVRQNSRCSFNILQTRFQGPEHTGAFD